MPSLTITRVQAANQTGQDTRLFDPFSDALALVLDLHASADLLALPQAAFSAEFQIFDPHLHKVVVSTSWGSLFNWGPNFWISKGNNWGPPADYQTAQRWGLSWSANSIFGVRGIVKAQYIPSAGAGWRATDAFDVSPMHWFRLREVFSL